MVCGSVGYGGVEELEGLKDQLRRASFDVVEQFEGIGRPTTIKDFRSDPGVSRRIMEHDMRLLLQADALVVISNRPSFGAGVEAYAARNAGKAVIAFCPQPVPTPWPIALATHIARSTEELLAALRTIEANG